MANGRCPLATQRGSARAAGSGERALGSLNKEASDGYLRGFRAGPTTLDRALLVTEEDGSTP
jgi:hypothetical protein